MTEYIFLPFFCILAMPYFYVERKDEWRMSRPFEMRIPIESLYKPNFLGATFDIKSALLHFYVIIFIGSNK